MAGMKCEACTFLTNCRSHGIIKTSRACDDFIPNWENLPHRVKYIRDRLPTLLLMGGPYYAIFEQYVRNKPILERLNLSINKRCASCVWYKRQSPYFDYVCSETPDVKANTPACEYWQLDMDKRAKSRHCPDILKKIITKYRRLERHWRPYIKFFIKHYRNLNSPVTINEGIEYQYNDSTVIHARVIDITEDSIIARNGKTSLTLGLSSFNQSWFKEGTRTHILANKGHRVRCTVTGAVFIRPSQNAEL